MSKIKFNTKGPQKFDEGTITILVKDQEGKLYLSEEIEELFLKGTKNVEDLLDGALGKSKYYFEKIKTIPDGTKNSDYSFVAANEKPFVLENNKIIIKEIKEVKNKISEALK